MSDQGQTDISYMRRALELASLGLYSTYPNPAVGCVIVKDGRIIGEGYHHKAGQPHAEIEALKSADYNVAGATCYVTLEPCSHYGRTPPCALKLVEMKVARVVIACGDPNPQVAGRGIKILRDAGIEVTEHVLEQEAFELNRAFFKAIVENIPYVSVKIGMSLDARTALASGESQWITGEESRSDVQDLRATSDALITGIGTVTADNPRLNVRYSDLPTEVRSKISADTLRQPLKVVLDSRGTLDINKYQLFTTGRVLWCTADDGVETTLEERINSQVTRVTLPFENGLIDLKALLAYLGTLGIRRALVEAGATLSSAFIEQALADEIICYVAPKIIGGSSKSTFRLPEIADLNARTAYKFSKTELKGADVKLTLRRNA